MPGVPKNDTLFIIITSLNKEKPTSNRKIEVELVKFEKIALFKYNVEAESHNPVFKFEFFKEKLKTRRFSIFFIKNSGFNEFIEDI